MGPSHLSSFFRAPSFADDDAVARAQAKRSISPSPGSFRASGAKVNDATNLEETLVDEAEVARARTFFLNARTAPVGTSPSLPELAVLPPTVQASPLGQSAEMLPPVRGVLVSARGFSDGDTNATVSTTRLRGPQTQLLCGGRERPWAPCLWFRRTPTAA
jgi:hypothetical protein